MREEELKENFRSLSYSVYEGFTILISLGCTIMFNLSGDKVWAAMGVISALGVLVMLVADVYKTLKFWNLKKSWKNEEKSGS